MKKKVVFIATIHRNAERTFPAVLKMSDTHDIIVICAGQVSKNTTYEANRFVDYLEKHSHNISQVIHSPAIRNPGELYKSTWRALCTNIFKKKIPFRETDLVILDDSRDKVGLSDLYRLCKKHGVPVVANTHGNTSEKSWQPVLLQGYKKFFDKLAVFGPKERENLLSLTKEDFFLMGGIPDNDHVKDLVVENEVILVIVNFIDPAHKQPGWYIYDKKTLDRMNLVSLQKLLKKPVVFKVKHRFGHNIAKEISILERSVPKGLSYNIISRAESDTKLIQNAACVLSYGSTMCFKPIQAKIPTVIFEQLGNVGNFDDYYGTVKMGEDYFDFILNPEKYESQRVEFLNKTISGGVKCESGDVYASLLYGVIDVWKKKNTNQ